MIQAATFWWPTPKLETRKADGKPPLVQVQLPPDRSGRSWVYPIGIGGVNRRSVYHMLHLVNRTESGKFPNVWEFESGAPSGGANLYRFLFTYLCSAPIPDIPLSRSTFSLIEMGRGNIFVSDFVALKMVFQVEYEDFFRDIPPSRQARSEE